jgi:hypothetical protein
MMLRLTLGEWSAVLFGVACHAALLAALTVRFGGAAGFLAKFVNALRAAAWIRAVWAVSAVLVMVVGSGLPTSVATVVAVPLVADMGSGAWLLEQAQPFTKAQEPDLDADEADPQNEYAVFRMPPGLHGSAIGAWCVALLQGVAVGIQLCVIALLVAGLRVWRTAARSTTPS